MEFTGEVHKLGENINTDLIIPARYLNVSDPEELAKHCFEDLDPTLREKVKPGDVVVAKENFGSGSSREHAPLAIKTLGISCIIATSFARIFYRNAINLGLPIMECPDAAENLNNGNTVKIDLAKGEITNLARNESYQATPFPEFIQEIIKEGGLMKYVKMESRGEK